MKSLHPLQPPHLRQANRIAILNHVRKHGPVSRPDIAKETGLSRPTVMKQVDDLLAEGLLREAGYAQPGGVSGRRPALVELNRSAAVALGVLLGVDAIDAAVVDLGARVLARQRVPTRPAEGPGAVISRMAEVSTALLEGLRGPGAPQVLGVGIGAPGLIRSAAGTVAFSPNLPGWREVELGRQVADRLGLPVLVDNEARVQALAEMWFGLGSGVENLIALETGIGIGAGIVIDGHLYRGVSSSAGEVGHTTIDPLGPPCACGNKGCWEAMASTGALCSLIKDALWRGEVSILNDWLGGNLEQLTLEHVVRAVQAGDALAYRYAVTEMGRRLGLGIANLVNIFNPERVVIHGEITDLGEPLLAEIRQTVAARALDLPGRRVDIRLSELGRDAGVIGAATLLINQVFTLELSAHAG